MFYFLPRYAFFFQVGTLFLYCPCYCSFKGKVPLEEYKGKVAGERLAHTYGINPANHKASLSVGIQLHWPKGGQHPVWVEVT